MMDEHWVTAAACALGLLYAIAGPGTVSIRLMQPAERRSNSLLLNISNRQG
jgi:hypothetical protein